MANLDNHSVKFFQNHAAKKDSGDLGLLIKAIDNGDKAMMISIFQKAGNGSLLASTGSENETPFEYALASVKLIEKYDVISKSDLPARKEIAAMLKQATLDYAEKKDDQSLAERTHRAIEAYENQTIQLSM